MPRFCLLLFCLFATCLQAQETDDDLAYSLGVRLGERLREEVPRLNLPALLEGLRHAYRGEKLKLAPARIEQLLAEHEARFEEAPVDSQRLQAAEREFLAREKARPGTRELAGGVLVSEIRAGSGKPPTSDDKVQVRYRGWLADGSLFDESDTPQWFRLDSVIEGWKQALTQMPVGAKWRLVIPSALAYGAEGAGDLIPPHAPLVFEVELLGAE
jgi:FKBP-type peptidyl-prolyl cis-trans isomerase